MNKSISLNKNQVSNINIESLYLNDGWVLLSGNTIRHESTKTTRISKTYENIFIKEYNYKVLFTISNYISCGVKVLINGIYSDEFNSNGIKEFIFKATDVSQEITFESDGFLDINNIQIKKIEQDYTFSEYNNPEVFEDKSFTVSYDLINNVWLSYHEYLPNNYIRNNTDFLIYDNKNINIKKSNNGTGYLKAVIEIIQNEYPIITKVLNSITTNLEANNINEEKVNDFFDKLIVYNEIQSTGEIALNNTNLTKKEKDWNINKLLDETIGKDNVKLFSKEWKDIKNNYFIDKVVKTDAIDTNKPWFKKGRLRDKYFAIRFIYDNLDMNKIILNFVNTQYRISQR